MRRPLLIWCLLLAGIMCIAQSERVSAFWQSRGSNYNKSIVSGGGGGFTGAGDVVSGALAWYSPARAYNAAYATGTGSLADIVDTATGTLACTIKAKTTGFADLTSIVCPTSSPTVSVTTFCTVTNPTGCSVAKLYDQTGNGIHVTQSNVVSMPLLSLSALNSLPCALGSLSSGFHLQSSGVVLNQAQPFSVSAVAERTANFTLDGTYFEVGTSAGNGALAGFGASANQVFYYAGAANIAATAADSAFHAVQTVFNAASSLAYIDGTLTPASATPGSDAPNSTSVIIEVFEDQFGNALTGPVCEVGLWGVGFSSGQYSGLNSNQHGANGYAF